MNLEQLKLLMAMTIDEIKDEPQLMLELYFLITAFINEEHGEQLTDDKKVLSILQEKKEQWNKTARSLMDPIPTVCPSLKELGWIRTERFYELRPKNNTT